MSSLKTLVAASDRELAKVRGQSANTLDLACRLLANSMHLKLVEGARREPAR